MADVEAAGTPAKANGVALVVARVGDDIRRLRTRTAEPIVAVPIALAVVSTCVALRLAWGDPSRRFAFLCPAVALATLIGGPRAGIAAMATAILAEGFILSGAGAAVFPSLGEIPFLLDFVATGLLIAGLSAFGRTTAVTPPCCEHHHEKAGPDLCATVDRLRQGVLVLAPDGELLSANPAAERILGLSCEEMSAAYRKPDDWPFLRSDGSPFPPGEGPVARAFAGTSPDGSSIVSWKRRDGDTVWMIEDTSPIRQAMSDRLDAILVSFSDVSEHRRAAQEANRSQARFASIVGSAMDAIISVDATQRVVLFNAAAERMFGLGADEARGRPLSSFLPTRYHDSHSSGFEQFTRSGETTRNVGHGNDHYACRADGTEFPIEASISRVEVDDRPLYTVILRDISERRSKERLLAERDEELRQTLDAAGLGVWWIDVDSGLLHCDPRSRRLFAVETDRISDVAARIHDEDRPAFLSLLESTEPAASEDPPGPARPGHPQVLRILHPDGGLAFLSLTARARRTAEGSAEIWGTVADVTEERRAEEAMRRFEASRRLEALGRMTGGIAHDLNNLLTVVSGNLQLLEMLPGSPESGRWIAEAIKASESGAALNNRLLTFARRRRLAPGPTDLNELVCGMTDILRRTAGARITVTTALASDIDPVVIDPTEIENGLINLVLNARDAMPDGGRIFIETAMVEIDETTVPPEDGVSIGEHVRLSVTDTGHGMTDDVKARAFEPFFTTKAHGVGSGLGLATLHGFVRQSGGFVTLYSEQGCGTTVNIYLPSSDDDRKHDRETRISTPIPGHGETILVAEDDPAVRRVTEERLVSIGYRVESVANSAAALARLARGPVDLVLTDVVMPGSMNGIELARSLRASDPDCRIVVVSGFAGDFVDGRDGTEIEFPFLRKPHSLGELAKTISDALAGTTGMGSRHASPKHEKRRGTRAHTERRKP